MSNKILRGRKKEQPESRKPVNCKSSEAVFEVLCSDRESVTLLNFHRRKLSNFTLLSEDMTLTKTRVAR